MSIAGKLIIQQVAGVTLIKFEDASILDASQIEDLAEQLYRLVDEMDRKQLLLDLTKVRFLASSAVGVLINLHKKATKIKGRMVIVGMRPNLMKIFEIMKIKKLFTFCATEEEGLSALGAM